MGYGTLTVSAYSNERDFIKEFCSKLSLIDNRITCPSSVEIDTIFANATEYTYVSIPIVIDGIYNLTLERGARHGLIENYYNVSMSIGSLYSSSSISYGERVYPSTVTTRTWKIKYLINSECFFLGFGSYDKDFNTMAWRFFEITKDSSSFATAVGESSSSSILSYDFIGTNNTQCVRKDRLSYTYDSTDEYTVEKLNKKIFVIKNIDNKAFEATTLHDVSTIAPRMDITINNVRYYSLDEHTIMEI